MSASDRIRAAVGGWAGGVGSRAEQLRRLQGCGRHRRDCRYERGGGPEKGEGEEYGGGGGCSRLDAFQKCQRWCTFLPPKKGMRSLRH